MIKLGTNGTIGCVGAGLLLLVACSAEIGSTESTATSNEELRRGGASHPGARPNQRHRGHRHDHGCGHGHGKGGNTGSGGGGGTTSAGSGGASTGGSGASSNGGSSTGGMPSGGSGGTAGTSGTGTGGSPEPGVCGDGVWSFDEQCDDGNVTSADGCDEACELEIGFVCPEPGDACRRVVCGDGFQDEYFVPGEGGTGGGSTGGGAGGATGGFPATGGTAGSAGSGTWVFEGCDDGNTAPGDGCDASCTVEDGFICDRPGEPCREPRCGDGFIDFIPGDGGTGGTGGTSSTGGVTTGGTAGTGTGGFAGGGTFEECDDGNSNASDGCDGSCVLEPGFVCPDPGLPCREVVCGDGIADWPGEECDDGNDVPDDGCTSCTLDAGTGGTGGTGTGGAAGTAGTGGTSTGGGG